MTIDEVINFKCDTKEHKKELLTELLKITKLKEKPNKNKLKEICAKLEHIYRYNIIYNIYNKSKDNKNWIISIKGFSGYIIFSCYSQYEALVKYILLVKSLNNYKKKVDKINKGWNQSKNEI